jgi:hypothetical protein
MRFLYHHELAKDYCQAPIATEENAEYKQPAISSRETTLSITITQHLTHTHGELSTCYMPTIYNIFL